VLSSRGASFSWESCDAVVVVFFSGKGALLFNTYPLLDQLSGRLDDFLGGLVGGDSH